MVRLQVPLLPSAPCPKVLVDSGRHGLLTPAHACRHPCSPPLRCSPERTGSLSKLRAVPCPRCGWALQQNKSLESDIMADAALADAEVLPPRAPPPSSRLWIESADSLALTTVHVRALRAGVHQIGSDICERLLPKGDGSARPQEVWARVRCLQASACVPPAAFRQPQGSAGVFSQWWRAHPPPSHRLLCDAVERTKPGKEHVRGQRPHATLWNPNGMPPPLPMP